MDLWYRQSVPWLCYLSWRHRQMGPDNLSNVLNRQIWKIIIKIIYFKCERSLLPSYVSEYVRNNLKLVVLLSDWVLLLSFRLKKDNLHNCITPFNSIMFQLKLKLSIICQRPQGHSRLWETLNGWNWLETFKINDISCDEFLTVKSFRRTMNITTSNLIWPNDLNEKYTAKFHIYEKLHDIITLQFNDFSLLPAEAKFWPR